MQQGEETSKNLLPLEADINPLKQKQGKERRRLTEREKPRMKPARTVCPREGNRTLFLGGEQELHAPAPGRVGQA